MNEETEILYEGIKIIKTFNPEFAEVIYQPADLPSYRVAVLGMAPANFAVVFQNYEVGGLWPEVELPAHVSDHPGPTPFDQSDFHSVEEADKQAKRWCLHAVRYDRIGRESQRHLPEVTINDQLASLMALD